MSTADTAGAVEGLLRELAPRVLGVLARRSGDFTASEDAVQEALVAAHRTWRRDGIPDRPMAWLVTAASRRLIDEQRSEASRRQRERLWAAAEPATSEVVQDDDTLVVLLMCCHPALTPGSAVALTLRAVGGLSTAEIAAAYAVPESTMATRISRAKRHLREESFSLPPGPELGERVTRALHVLYLLFNEGYAATAGPHLTRTDLSAEAIRLSRTAVRLLPENRAATALLALFLLLDARRPARLTASGEVVPLAEQDRGLWDQALVAEGTALLDSTLGTGPLGAYQVQAAIAAVHDRAATADATDWPQVLALYGLLEQVAPSPFVTLARAVALAEVDGPDAAATLVDDVAERLPGHHRVNAVRGHLAELRGDPASAREHYLAAAGRTTNLAEQRHLTRRAAVLAARGEHEGAKSAPDRAPGPPSARAPTASGTLGA